MCLRDSYDPPPSPQRFPPAFVQAAEGVSIHWPRPGSRNARPIVRQLTAHSAMRFTPCVQRHRSTCYGLDVASSVARHTLDVTFTQSPFPNYPFLSNPSYESLLSKRAFPECAIGSLVTVALAQHASRGSPVGLQPRRTSLAIAKPRLSEAHRTAHWCAISVATLQRTHYADECGGDQEIHFTWQGQRVKRSV